MYKIRKAYKEDFEKVYPLFEFFNNANISKEHWANLFKPICKEMNNDFFGFVLTREEECVGFIACIMSIRNISEKKIKICNMSSWVINPKFKKEINSFQLINTVVEMKDFYFLNFTPMQKSILFYTRFLDFKEFITKYYVLLGYPIFKNLLKKRMILINNPIIKDHLNKSDVSIFEDHQLPDVYHVLYPFKKEKIYCIIKPTLYNSDILYNSSIIKVFSKIWFKLFRKDFFSKKIYLGMVHYTNNPESFTKSIQENASIICKSIKVMGLSINEKYNLKENIFTFKNNNEYHSVYKLPEEINFNDLNTLYSEFLILNINQ